PTFPIGTYYGPAPISNAVVSPCTYLRQLGAMNKNNLVVGGVIGNRGNAGSGIFPRYRLRFPKNGFLTCGNFYFFYGFGVGQIGIENHISGIVTKKLPIRGKIIVVVQSVGLWVEGNLFLLHTLRWGFFLLFTTDNCAQHGHGP